MPACVTFVITSSTFHGREITFQERTTCLAGRQPDCPIRLPDDKDHATVSRYHCLFDIRPPDVRVRDFGSLNGTAVNGVCIGKRPAGMDRDAAIKLALPEHDLKDGDEVLLGNTALRVCVVAPAMCDSCGVELPDEPGTDGADAENGKRQCTHCRAGATVPQPASAKPAEAPLKCVQCGRDVTGRGESMRPGAALCSACRTMPYPFVNHVLRSAVSDSRLAGFRGYQILRELDRGGMGAVYLARHETSGELVALKVMLPQGADGEAARTQFLREAENTRALRHRHVVEFRDMVSFQDGFCFAMEYCDGGNVRNLMTLRGGRLPLDEAVEIVFQALDGLDYAHNAPIPNVRLEDGSYAAGRGLVHRDIKPHNLFLTGTGSGRTVKVGDFGLAKAFDLAGLSGLTCTGSLMGTPVFMPRQQVIDFKRAEPAVDVWAVAASLYYMLTEAYPRDFPQNVDPWLSILLTSAVAIRKRDPAIPKALAAVIDHALIDNPEIPFRSAAEFRHALEEAL